MKTERELYIKANYAKLEGDTLVAVKDAFEAAWQARVPEGYVVVPKEPSAKLVNHGHQVFLGHFNEGGQTGGLSLYFAYKAMIEAVEK